MSSTPATSPPETAADRQRRRERRGLIGLVVMVVAILAFTAVSVAIELASNRGKSFQGTVDVLGPVPGADNEVRLRFQVTNTGNRGGRPDKCEAILYDLRGERVGVAEISLRQPIAPGQTHLEEAIGTAAAPPVNGRVHCRGLEPGWAAASFLSLLTGSFAEPAAENPTVAMIEAAYRHHGIDACYLDRRRGAELVAHLGVSTPAAAELVAWDGTCRVPAATDTLGNATSVGLFPDVDARLDLNPDTLRPAMVVADVIPNPPSTVLLRAAQRRGCTVLDGIGMLVNQG